MNKITTTLLISLASSLGSVYAKPIFLNNSEAIIKSIRCSKAKEVIKSWGAQSQWIKYPRRNLDQVELKTPTDQFGKWVSVDIDGDKLSTSLLSLNTQQTIDWNKKCEPRISVKQREKSKNTSFTDRKLKSLILKNSNGLVYTWSPHMPYSIRGIKEVLKAAKKFNLPVKIVLSPHSNLDFAKEKIKEHKLPTRYLERYDSLEMYFRGSSIHHPSLLSYKNKKLKRTARPGYEVSAHYEKYLSETYKK